MGESLAQGNVGAYWSEVQPKVRCSIVELLGGGEDIDSERWQYERPIRKKRARYIVLLPVARDWGGLTRPDCSREGFYGFETQVIVEVDRRVIVRRYCQSEFVEFQGPEGFAGRLH